VLTLDGGGGPTDVQRARRSTTTGYDRRREKLVKPAAHVVADFLAVGEPLCTQMLTSVHTCELSMAASRHPNGVIEEALAYAREHGWDVSKARGGSAHAWGVMRRPRDCPQVSIFSTPRVPENHARALLRAVDRCPHGIREETNG
jgi:hypothetical protein